MSFQSDAETSTAPTRDALARLSDLLAALSDRPVRADAGRALALAAAMEAQALDGADDPAEGDGKTEQAWRALVVECAHLVRWTGLGLDDRARAAAHRAGRLLDAIPGDPAAAFADPHTGSADPWLVAADRFVRSSAPFESVVIGLREAGAGRSALIAAALEGAGRRCESLTLRRRPETGGPARFDGRLAERLRRKAADGAWFLIVDEGSDTSGAPVCEAARDLAGLGVGDEQIVLFPRAEAREPLQPELKAQWSRHRRSPVGGHLLLLA